MPQQAPMAGRTTISSRVPARKPPSVVLVGSAREVFRRHVRPLQQYSADRWQCRTGSNQIQRLVVTAHRHHEAEACGYHQQCTALRCKTGWPATLPCGDPNNKGTNMLIPIRATEVLRFASAAGWHAEPVQANQPR